MKKERDLCEVLYCIVMCAVMLFYGFAAGVWAGEWEEPVEPVTEIRVEAPVVDNRFDVGDSSASPQNDRTAGEGFCGPDPMIEDTYLMPEHPLPLDKQVLLYGACLEMGVDYQLALAVIEQETGYRSLMGDDGESAGYMQVQEKWHRERMALLGVDDLMDPKSNFRVGCHFLKECIDKYGLERGLGFYNGGVAKVTDYSREVLGRLS